MQEEVAEYCLLPENELALFLQSLFSKTNLALTVTTAGLNHAKHFLNKCLQISGLAKPIASVVGS